jgi:hypothetical protein
MRDQRQANAATMTGGQSSAGAGNVPLDEIALAVEPPCDARCL